MVASVHIIKCYGENAKNFGLVYIHAFCVSNGTLKLKLTKSGRVHIINYPQSRFGLVISQNELLRDEQ